jgi:ribosomal protein L37AE/L43A
MGKFCMDCGKRISSEAARCRACAAKSRLALSTSTPKYKHLEAEAQGSEPPQNSTELYECQRCKKRATTADLRFADGGWLCSKCYRDYWRGGTPSQTESAPSERTPTNNDDDENYAPSSEESNRNIVEEVLAASRKGKICERCGKNSRQADLQLYNGVWLCSNCSSKLWEQAVAESGKGKIEAPQSSDSSKLGCVVWLVIFIAILGLIIFGMVSCFRYISSGSSGGSGSSCEEKWHEYFIGTKGMTPDEAITYFQNFNWEGCEHSPPK